MAVFPGAVKTFTSKSDGAGNKIFASHVNDLQDEVNAIEDGLLNASASLNVGHVAATALAVSAGSTLTTLNVTGGSTLNDLYVTVSPPHASVFRGSTVTLANNTTVGISFDSQRKVAPASMHSTASNSSRLVAPSSGVYHITGHVNYAGFSSIGVRISLIVLNDNSTIAALSTPGNAANGGSIQHSLSRTYPMAANDYVVLRTFQDSGSTGSLAVADAYSQEFTLTKIR